MHKAVMLMIYGVALEVSLRAPAHLHCQIKVKLSGTVVEAMAGKEPLGASKAGYHRVGLPAVLLTAGAPTSGNLPSYYYYYVYSIMYMWIGVYYSLGVLYYNIILLYVHFKEYSAGICCREIV